MLKMNQKYLSILFLFVSFSISGQAPNNNWERVLELPEQFVFVDTSNIKQIEKQISALGLSVYKSPQYFDQLKKEASAVKTQLVFDVETRKYTVIGTLYYDKQWKILGESSSPGRSINTALFGMPIDSSIVISSVFSRCMEVVAKKQAAASAENTSNKKEKINSRPKSDQKEIPVTQEVKKETEPDNRPQREILTEKFIDKKLLEESNPTGDSKPNPTIKPDVAEVKKDGTYNSTVEKVYRGTIFTDGSKYCFQVSSWKNKQQAELEVKRLSNAGHNAFISEAYLANRGGTWFRVRIGYFSSAEEAEKYQRSFK